MGATKDDFDSCVAIRESNDQFVGGIADSIWQTLLLPRSLSPYDDRYMH